MEVIDAPRTRTWEEIQQLIQPTPEELHWGRCAYVSSRYENKDLVQAFSLKCATIPKAHICIQRWSKLGDETGKTMEQLAFMDLQDIDMFPNFIQLTDKCEVSRGGMHVELGYALAQHKNCIIVGPRITVFHYLPSLLWFPTIQDYFTHFVGA